MLNLIDLAYWWQKKWESGQFLHEKFEIQEILHVRSRILGFEIVGSIKTKQTSVIYKFSVAIVLPTLL